MNPSFFTPQQTTTKKKIPVLFPKCGKCSVKTKTHVRGVKRLYPNSPIMLVLTRPTQDEYAERTPLVGYKYEILEYLISDLKLPRNQISITYAVQCMGAKQEDSVFCCANVIRDIKKVKPKVVLLLGTSAINSIVGTYTPKNVAPLKLVGNIIPIPALGCYVIPTYNVSDMGKKYIENIMNSHFQKALTYLNVPFKYETVENLQKQIDVILDTKKALKQLKEINRQKGISAFDYETTGLKPESPLQRVWSMSIYFKGKTIAFKYEDILFEEWCKYLANQNIKKIASNLKFEERWSICKFNTPVANWYWDTMLESFLSTNMVGTASVKLLGFLYFGLGTYDSHISPYLQAPTPNSLNRINELDIEELLIYNGVDSLLEYKVAKHQRSFTCTQ